MSQSVPVIPQGLYKFGPVDSEQVCVDFGVRTEIMSAFEYWNTGYEPWQFSLPTRDQFTKAARIEAPAKRSEFKRQLARVIERIEETRSSMESMERIAEELRFHDDYWHAAGSVHAHQNRLKLRYAEREELEKFLAAPAVFPELEPGQLVYEIAQDEATKLSIDLLHIPDDVTLRPAPGVKAIDWHVRVLKFGRNSTFDLSAPQSKSLPPPQPSKLAQAAPGLFGAQGKAGIDGAPGDPGVSLTLRGIERIEPEGSLWIRTDGGPGGDGGKGGEGQQGGSRTPYVWGRRAKPGGAGGVGGRGGNGGSTSSIRLNFKGGTNSCGIASEPAPGYAPSQRPEIGTASISIYGAAGCGGQGGDGGPPGSGGGPNQPIGVTGDAGSAGEAGSLGDADISQGTA